MVFKILKNYYHILILAVFIISFYGSPATAADQDFFNIYSLEIDGIIYNFLTGDFNGDDLNDILMIYSPNNDPEVRYLGLYLQKNADGFKPSADYLTPLSPGVAQLDIADIDGDGKDEIYLIDGDGVSRIKFSPDSGLSKPARIVRTRTIYSVPIFQGIIVDRFLYELNNVPGPEMIVPNSEGYVIYEQGDDGIYQILNQLTVPILGTIPKKSIKQFSSFKQPEWKISQAEINVFDGNLDGLNDLYFLWDRKLCQFFQDTTGNFSQIPNIVRDFYSPDENGYIQSQVIDYNGDQHPDVAVSYTGGGITKTETRVRFYVADSRGVIEANYSKEITLSDSHCNLLIGDFDHNNTSDMAISAIELGALAATKMFLMKNADLHILVYPFDSGLPEDEPAKRLKYEFRFNFDDPQPIIEVSIDWSADFNGDGLSDLVFTDGNGNLKFYWGQAGDYLSRKPDLEISLDHPAEIHPIRLNNGTLSDLVIEHNLGGRLNRLTVLKNRNNIL